ncbi:right-handed parallel beta-helix repeat-containing protein [bacterium]|nr:right-handed parallel beta-helix repeat-containing protein [bacterium]
MKIMRIDYLLSSLALAAFIWFGCSDPVSNPVLPPDPNREGDTLRVTTGTIGPSGTGKPWLIAEDWVIPEGSTVTIQPGTEIMVLSGAWIDVQGVIVAEGTPSDPIIFTSSKSDPDLGQWRGLKLHNREDGSVFRYCIFTYGALFDTDTLSPRGVDAQLYKGMLAIRNSSPTIEHCIVTHNQNNAVYISDSLEYAPSNPRIRYNIFTGNDASAVRADGSIDPHVLDIAYNNVADNSAPGFILTNDTSYFTVDSVLVPKVFGDLSAVNGNLDSCDSQYNIDTDPLFIDPAVGLLTRLANFGVESCSPVIDAGPFDMDPDADGTRADMGTRTYTQAAFELRGRLEGNLQSATYRMSCDVVIPPEATVVIPAGAKIEATGLFNIEVYGRLLVGGTEGNPVEYCPCLASDQDRLGGIIFYERGAEPSVISYLVIDDFTEVVVGKPRVRFEHTKFLRGFEYGVAVLTNSLTESDAVVFENCTFESSGTTAIGAVSSSMTVERCRISGSRGHGVWLAYVGESVVIENSVIEACTTDAIYMQDFCDPRLVNNTIRGAGYYGISMEQNCLPFIVNNIVTDCGRAGISARLSSSPYLDYNDVWNNGTREPQDVNYIPSTLDVGNSISQDALLSGSDLRLGAGSPCVNAGHPDSEYNDPDGSRNDIGAWGGPGSGSVGAGYYFGGLLARR